MPAATVPMPVAIGREDQELPLSTSSYAGFVRCAITNGSAMPSHMATDPLVSHLLPARFLPDALCFFYPKSI